MSDSCLRRPDCGLEFIHDVASIRRLTIDGSMSFLLLLRTLTCSLLGNYSPRQTTDKRQPNSRLHAQPPPCTLVQKRNNRNRNRNQPLSHWPSMAEEGSEQITFNVKSSSDAKHVLTVPLNMTVGDLKNKLSAAEYANIPAERQRLIYSGRVLKDPDTLATCKIKDGNTVHLVKGAESNQRQNPANSSSGAAVPPGAGVPQNIQAGGGVGNPLSQLTGARYAGFHGLPGADMFGADGGMGAPPNSDQMLRMLDDPNFAQQMNEAMNNPAVIDMLRNNPMIRNNPMARAAIENPELRRMMMNPEMIRMQMQMQRAMGGQEGGEGAFPMPGATDTTTENNPSNPSTATNPEQPAGAANPFAALFPGGAGGPGGAAGTGGENAQGANPFASLLGGAQGASGNGNQNNAIASAAQQMMQNPEMMQNMMRMMGGGGGDAGAAGGAGGAGAGGFNPFAALGGGAGGFGGMGGLGGGAGEPAAPADTRPPEERYADQLQQLNDMGFYEFERNVTALRRSGGSVQGAVEYLLSGA
jgi:ubiquilin